MDKKIAEELLSFIHRSPSCFHAVENLAEELERAGARRLYENQRWELTEGGKYYVIRNGSALIGFQIPENRKKGFLVAAAHSDAPTMKLKADPELENEHYVRLNVEKYGGGILSTWLDRPLSIAGRITCLQDGKMKVKPVWLNEDLALIPNLAIHMNRQMNEGVALNPQIDILPLIGGPEAKGELRKRLAEAAGAAENEILDFDLFLSVREQGHIWGLKEEFISSPRLDDLQGAWACVQGFIQAEHPACIPLCVVFDNEEVGSGTKQGADSDFLRNVLERISACLGEDLQEYQTALASSLMLSVDNGHAIHPNHPEKADVTNHPHMNGGIVIKYSANQKYTTDSVAAGLLKILCKEEGVPVQTFVNRSDIAGGSTLGNISTTQVSLNTVDIGLAQLAMHSAVETGGVKDTAYLLKALRRFYQAQVVCEEDEYQIL